MHRVALLLALGVAGCSSPTPDASSTSTEQPRRWGIVIHTGAGNFTLQSLGDRAEPIRVAMTEALTAGHRVLAGGGASLDAVQAAIVILEDSPLFNAGKGAVFTHDGKNELDASIMDGATRRAGAVAGVTRVKNPIALARLVMEKSPHVMLSRDGAEAFAMTQGVELVPESYFHTDRAWQALQRALEQERAKPSTAASAAPATDVGAGFSRPGNDSAAYFGTVGAVALDQQGNLAAGTSTGGMTNKRWGRIGDSPVIGAGTYASHGSLPRAESRGCAVSSTGHGEFFIRYAVAHDICARVEYRGMTVQAAADAVVNTVLKSAGGEGGVIGMDRDGNVAMSINVTGMGRGYMGMDGKATIQLVATDK